MLRPICSERNAGAGIQFVLVQITLVVGLGPTWRRVRCASPARRLLNEMIASERCSRLACCYVEAIRKLGGGPAGGLNSPLAVGRIDLMALGQKRLPLVTVIEQFLFVVEARKSFGAADSTGRWRHRTASAIGCGRHGDVFERLGGGRRACGSKIAQRNDTDQQALGVQNGQAPHLQSLHHLQRVLQKGV
jgi:hypothetical protein